jgi:hypothetical protein
LNLAFNLLVLNNGRIRPTSVGAAAAKDRVLASSLS